MARSLSASLGGLAVVGVLALTSGASYATDDDDDDDDLPFVCSLEAVAGVYGFNFDHARPPDEASPFAQAPFATVGLLELHPDGSFDAITESVTEVAEGQVIEDEFSGTWMVEEDCIGRLDAEAGQAEDFDGVFVAVENASELLLSFGFVSEEVDAKRVFKEEDKKTRRSRR